MPNDTVCSPAEKEGCGTPNTTNTNVSADAEFLPNLVHSDTYGGDGSICPSIAYEGCQTPCMCMTWMCDPLWVGLKPHCMCYGMVYSPAVTQDFG